MQRTFVGRGVHGLRREVGAGPAQRPSEGGAFLDEIEDLPRETAVTAQQMLDPRHVYPAAVGEGLPGVPQRLVAVSAEQRYPVGAGQRHVPVHSGQRGVDRITGHHSVGRVLPTGDHGQTRQRRDDRMLPGQP